MLCILRTGARVQSYVLIHFYGSREFRAQLSSGTGTDTPGQYLSRVETNARAFCADDHGRGLVTDHSGQHVAALLRDICHVMPKKKEGRG